MSWREWSDAVLDDIGAPVDAVNLDSLWAWSAKESGAYPMRWNNPLNTTWRLPGSVSMNSVGVQSYVSVSDGVTATVSTLLQQGYYPTIVANLRASVPRVQWQNACGQLDLWGTGCDWLSALYGDFPGSIGGDDDMFTDADRYMLQGLLRGEVWDAAGVVKGKAPFMLELEAKIAAIAPGQAPDMTKVLEDLDSLATNVLAVKAVTDKIAAI